MVGVIFKSLCLLVLFPLSGFGQSWFYSPDSVPVRLNYRTYFQVAPSEVGHPLDSDEAKQKIQELIKLHSSHLYGVFTYHEKPHDFVNFSGSIKDVGISKILSVVKKSRNIIRIEYEYTDEAVFYYEVLNGKQSLDLEFFMPTNPTTIYKRGFPKKPVLDPHTKEPMNLCTSHHDNSEEAFFYYWSPHREGCPKSFKKYIHLVQANITTLPSTTKTYPEYELLYTQDQLMGKNHVRFSVLVGMDEKFDDPKDLGRVGFEQSAIYFGKQFNLMQSTENERHYRYETERFIADVDLLYLDPDAETWPETVSKILENSSVIIWSGHSAEGAYFDPQLLFGEQSDSRLPKDKYQIIFFNACTTYSYFHSNYFDLKKSVPGDPFGTKHLDLMTNVIGAPFLENSISPDALTLEGIVVSALLGRYPDGSKPGGHFSWQQILNLMSEFVGYDFTALSNVIGDEDNPTVAPKVAVP